MDHSRTVTKVYESDKDKLIYEGLKNKKVTYFKQPKNYTGRVVVKPWGYEFLFFENTSIAAWFLYIKKGHSTSMHCHPGKTTSLVLLKGRARVNTFRNRNIVDPGSGVFLGKKVFHSTNACYDEDICLFEIESPPQKGDLMRLEDNYGRSNLNYESCTEMEVDNLERFNFFQLSSSPGGDTARVLPHVQVSLTSPNMMSHSWDPDSLYCACDTHLCDCSGASILDLGEIALGASLPQARDLQKDDNTCLMEIKFHE